VTRGIAAFVVLLAVSSVWAQTPERPPDDDLRWNPAETRQERRQRIRQERDEAREERRERVEQWREERRERIEHLGEGFDGVHLRVLRSYTLAEGETSAEPVVVIGGSARIDGRVEDDVVVVGGGLHLGPKAFIQGDVVTVGGSVTREAGATVQGTTDEAVFWPGVSFDPDWSAWWPTLSFWGLILRLSFTMVVAMLLTFVAPGWISNISNRSAGASAVTGLAVEVLFVPVLIIVTVMLIVSIIGIPLLAAIPFVLAALALLWVAGFTGVAVRIGRALRGGGDARRASVLDFLIGYAVIVGLTVLGHVMAYALGWLSPASWPVRSFGLLVEYVAWTIGLGAAVTSVFTQRRVMPPPVPI
jgi:hypothetical protein